MKLKHYTDIELEEVTMDGARKAHIRWLIAHKDGAPNFAMRMFEVEPGGFTPYHSHEWEHEIFIHSGKGEVFRNGEWVSVESGYSIFIPGNEEHQIKNKGDDPFVFVCLIPSGAPEI